MMKEVNAMNKKIFTIAIMVVAIPVIAITWYGYTLPPADDPHVLGGISVAIMIGVLVTFLYIIHNFDFNPEYSYSEGRYP
jgi:quinol-cytochrome oxidoreductase complex cytochrome b subunit